MKFEFWYFQTLIGTLSNELQVMSSHIFHLLILGEIGFNNRMVAIDIKGHRVGSSLQSQPVREVCNFPMAHFYLWSYNLKTHSTTFREWLVRANMQ